MIQSPPAPVQELVLMPTTPRSHSRSWWRRRTSDVVCCPTLDVGVAARIYMASCLSTYAEVACCLWPVAWAQGRII
eukprot:COSAG01_NODE_27309_length_689_cov_0.752542_2_plen_75_part_01